MRFVQFVGKDMYSHSIKSLLLSIGLLFSSTNHAENYENDKINTIAILVTEVSQRVGDEPTKVLLALNDNCHYFASVSSKELGKIKLIPIKGICKKDDRSGIIEENFNNLKKLVVTVDASISENFYTGEKVNKLTAMKKIDIYSWLNNN